MGLCSDRRDRASDIRSIDPVRRKNMIRTIIEEMTKGNFSFLILVVGIVQVIVMIKKR